MEVAEGAVALAEQDQLFAAEAEDEIELSVAVDITVRNARAASGEHLNRSCERGVALSAQEVETERFGARAGFKHEVRDLFALKSPTVTPPDKDNDGALSIRANVGGCAKPGRSTNTMSYKSTTADRVVFIGFLCLAVTVCMDVCVESAGRAFIVAWDRERRLVKCRLSSAVEPVADSGARMSHRSGYASAVRDFSTASCVTW